MRTGSRVKERQQKANEEAQRQQADRLRREAEENLRKERERDAAAKARQHAQNYQSQYVYWDDFNIDNMKDFDILGKTSQMRTLKCCKCGSTQETFYMGEPSTYRCFGCWNK